MLGRALLPGLVICKRCGFRMTTRYQGKSSQPRYLCDRGRNLYGRDRCQGVSARVIDDEVVRLALLALAPAALDVSLEVAADVERDRERLETHWQGRLERDRYEVERARRQYDAVEPENRLVARTLEQVWEERLRNLQHLEQEHHRVRQDRSPQLTTHECEQIRRLATDLPALWSAAATTDEDRKQILHELVERVTLNVEGDGEWVEVHVHWAGGRQTYGRVRRPVAGTSQLSRWTELKDQLRILKSAGLSAVEIADELHARGFKPAKGSRITSQVVRIWLCRYGLSRARKATNLETASNEWTIPQIVDRYQIAVSTIHGWIRRHRVPARQIGGPGGRWIRQATVIELDALVNNRRTSSKSADQESDNSRIATKKSVSRGVV